MKERRTLRHLCLILAVFLTLSCLTVVLFAEPTTGAKTGWDGTEVDYSWYWNDGALVKAGTKFNPYLIGTAAQLAALEKLINHEQDALYLDTLKTRNSNCFDGTYFKLTADIDMGGKHLRPLGGVDGYYSALIFDGNGKTVSNLKQISTDPVTGLFGRLGKGAEISHLNLVGCSFEGQSDVGAIAGIARDGATVLRCTTDSGTVVKATGKSVGGMIGYAHSFTADPVTVSHCINEASVSITGTDEVRCGGIVGYADGADAQLVIAYCVNKGALTASTTGNQQTCIAGMIAKAFCEPNQDRAKSTVRFSYNSGTMTSGTQTTGGYKFIGGAIGFSQKTHYEVSRFFDSSVRTIAESQKLYNNAVVGDTNGAGYTRTVTDSFSATAKGGNGGTQVSSIDAEITLTDGVSTIRREMEKIDGAIAALTPVAFSCSLNLKSSLSAKMKLIEDANSDFGLMVITNFIVNGEVVPVDAYEEKYGVCEFGFTFLAGDKKMTVAEIDASDAKVSDQGMKYDDNRFSSVFGGVKAANLDSVVSFYAYAVLPDGTVVKSDSRGVNLYKLVTDLSDGYLGGTSDTEGAVKIENEKEVQVYQAMLGYYEACRNFISGN